jgi:hypothetical protein
MDATDDDDATARKALAAAISVLAPVVREGSDDDEAMTLAVLAAARAIAPFTRSGAYIDTAMILASAMWWCLFARDALDPCDVNPYCVGGSPLLAFARAISAMTLQSGINATLGEGTIFIDPLPPPPDEKAGEP